MLRVRRRNRHTRPGRSDPTRISLPVPRNRAFPPAAPPDPERPFWRVKRLEELNATEWESLCDGCGRCCLLKLEDEDTGEVFYTDVGCTLLDSDSCRCSDYVRRQEKVADCLRLTPESVRTVPWLPPTCGYRRVAEGRDLAPWHPLVSGDPDSVHRAGISVRGRVAGPEELFDEEELLDHVVAWPEEPGR